ncbi:MAG: hypothetical protein ACOC22_02710 [bacterium]
MFENKQFYKNLLESYIDIDIPPMYQEIGKIGGAISWYLADSQDNLISIEQGERKIVEVDIKSAFPTICRNLYGNDSEFIKTMDSIDEKRGKNIFIATNLKGQPLRTINNISKICVVGLIFDTDDQDELENIDILELKKDGCIIACNDSTINRLKNINQSNMKFTNYLVKHNFLFHLNNILKYLRCNHTSYILQGDNEFAIKGIYKHCPTGLLEIIKKIFSENKYDKEEILKIYSHKFFRIAQRYNLMEILNKYYISDKKIILPTGKYKNYNMNLEIDPRIYLKIYVFPMLLSQIKKI